MSREPRQGPVIPGLEALTPIAPVEPTPPEVAQRLAVALGVMEAPKSASDGPQASLLDAIETEASEFAGRRGRVRITAAGIFGRAAAADILRRDMFEDLTPEMAAEVEPWNLVKGLFGRDVHVNEFVDGKVRGREAVLYKDRKDRWQALAVSARERPLFITNIEAYSNGASAQVKNGRKHQMMASPDPDAPTRGVIHALDARLPRIEAYLRTLQSQHEIVRQLRAGLQPKNLAERHTVGKVRDVQQMMVTLEEQVLPTMIEALADQRGWNTAKVRDVRRAIEYRMYIDRLGTAGKHLKFNKQLFGILDDYIGIKVRVLDDIHVRGQTYREQNVASLAGTTP